MYLVILYDFKFGRVIECLQQQHVVQTARSRTCDRRWKKGLEADAGSSETIRFYWKICRMIATTFHAIEVFQQYLLITYPEV